jgi:hypothetical protein
VGAIQSFVKENSNENGFAVRLVGRNDSLQNVAKSSGVLALVPHSVDYAHNVTNFNHTPYWSLGDTPQEWRQTPLTKDWLLRTNDNRQGCLVLEADLSSDSLPDYLSQQDTPTSQPIDNVTWVSKILGMIAEQNGVVSPSEQANESPVNVLIVSDDKPPPNDNTIYIYGPQFVGAELLSVLEKMNSKPLLEKSEEETTDDSSSEGDQNGPGLISAFDYVGMKLRQGGTRILTGISGVFSRREQKRVYVISQASFVPFWLRQIMPYEWTVLAYNALDVIKPFQESITEDGGGGICLLSD